MQVKRFVAADMRRALELVRAEMGPDAVILSSRRIKEGVEIMTTLEDQPLVPAANQGLVPSEDHSSGYESPMASDSAWGDQAVVDSAINEHLAEAGNAAANLPAAAANAASEVSGRFGQLFQKESHAQSQSQSQKETRGLASGKTSQQLAEEIEQARHRMLAARKAQSSALEQHSPQPQQPQPREAVSQPIAPREVTSHEATSQTTPSQLQGLEKQMSAQRSSEAVAQDKKLNELQAELAGMRQLLEEQLGRLSLSQMAAKPSVLTNIWRRFEQLGLPSEISNQVLQQLTQQNSMAEAWPEALGILSHQLPINSTDVVDKGGVFAFVGPTGVGKTTTVGKLAARYVLKHGSDKVALVTTDTYRIAAYDQLRALGRILKVPVRVVDDNNSLPNVLERLKDYPLVLIDTAGFRHGDPLLKEQLTILQQQQQVQSYLVLACNSQMQMLKASVHAYKSAGLQGCILTKLDESASLGGAMGVVLDQSLPVAYTTDGQEIPQDIDVARAHKLVSKAVALMKQGMADTADVAPFNTVQMNTDRQGVEELSRA